jgi:hypothetical protein
LEAGEGVAALHIRSRGNYTERYTVDSKTAEKLRHFMQHCAKLEVLQPPRLQLHATECNVKPFILSVLEIRCSIH